MIERILNFYLKKVHPLRYAKRIGVSMGGDGRLIGSPIWGSEPWLITIGKRVEIANEVGSSRGSGTNVVNLVST